MFIVKIEPDENGFHAYQSQSHRTSVWLDGYIEAPENLAEEITGTNGFCDLDIQDGKLVGVTSTLNSNPEYLEKKKSEKIAKSKSDLSTYLESHPLLWSDGENYSITAEKQQQLTSKLFSAYTKKASGVPYDLSWNSTGEVCKSWTIEDLSSLAYAIEARVTSLVAYQQAQEVAMRNATTQEDLDAIVVDYDSVPLPGGAV